MKRSSFSIVVLVLMVLSITTTFAHNYQINWYSINSGGGAASGGTYTVNASVGQAVAGYVSSVSLSHWIGFWVGDWTTPIVVSTLDGVKLYEDGTLISVSGKIATSGVSHFSGFFYLEEQNRSSGIRVVVSSWPVANLAPGSVVNVVGTMGKTASGERQITAPSVIITSTTTPLKPLGMTNRSVGGGDLGDPVSGLGQYGVTGGVGLNNVGMFITTWGQVIEVGSGYALVTDGAGGSVRIDTSILTSPPDIDSYISVIGMSSLYTGRLPLILPRMDSDIMPY